MTRRQARGLETRDRIRTAALTLFSARPFTSVTIDEIAVAAGVTKGAVYYWFADKDDLVHSLRHLLQESLALASIRRLASGDQGDPVTNMRGAFAAYLDALGDLGEARFFLRDSWPVPDVDDAPSDHAEGTALVRAMLGPAIQRGELEVLDVDALARVLTGMWSEAVLFTLETGDRSGATKVVEHFVESLRSPSQRLGEQDSRRGARRDD